MSQPFGIPRVTAAPVGNLAKFAAGGVLADSGAPALNVSKSPVRVYASSAGCVADCIVSTGAKIGGGTPTDNATALNAILALATASNPIELVLDGGYAIGTSLLIPAIGNVTIRGLGWGTGLFILAGSNTNAISSQMFGTTNASYAAIYAATNYAPTGNGIFGQTGANVTVRDLKINGNRAVYPNGNVNGVRDGSLGNTSPPADARSPYPSNYWLNAIALCGIDNVLIDNVHCYDIPGFSVSLFACRYVRVVNSRFESPKVGGVRGANTDGVHVNGGCSDVTVDHCLGQTGDDVVAFNVEEGNQVAGADFKATNITLDDAPNGVRVYGSNVTQTQRVIISGITGTASSLFAVVIGVGAGSTVTGLNHSISISDVEVAFDDPSAVSVVCVSAFTGSLVLDNVRIVDPVYPISMVKLQGTPTLTDLTLHNCHIQRTQAGNAAAFFVYGQSGSVQNLNVSDCTMTQEAGYTYADVNYAIDMYAGLGTSTVANANISNCVFNGVGHAYFAFNGGNVTVNGLVYTTHFSDIAVLNLYSGTFTLSVANVVINGGSPLYSTASGTITIGGTSAIGSLSLTGVFSLPSLPTSDPHVVGQVWSNSHVLTVSAG